MRDAFFGDATTHRARRLDGGLPSTGSQSQNRLQNRVKSYEIARNRAKRHAIFRDFADDPVKGRPGRAALSGLTRPAPAAPGAHLAYSGPPMSASWHATIAQMPCFPAMRKPSMPA